VVQAGRGFEIASAQYREGLSSQLELTDAEVALRQSEYNYAQAVYDYLVFGRGWTRPWVPGVRPWREQTRGITAGNGGALP
jgi:hypothetical protein